MCDALQVLTRLKFRSFLFIFLTDYVFTNIKTPWCSSFKNFDFMNSWKLSIKSTLKNKCKLLRYYFPNEITNSTHSNDKILRLKQYAKFKTYPQIYIRKSLRLSLTNRYYIPKCFVTGLRVRLYERRLELKPVWDFKPVWNEVLFRWRFISAVFLNDPIFWWKCLGILFWVVFPWYIITWNDFFLSKWPKWNKAVMRFWRTCALNAIKRKICAYSFRFG